MLVAYELGMAAWHRPYTPNDRTELRVLHSRHQLSSRVTNIVLQGVVIASFHLGRAFQ